MLAALRALADDDMENALVALTPGGIEAQERTGQIAFVANETLPIKCNHGTREQFEAMGIEYGDPVDDLFVQVSLPEGWSKVGTGHSMWSDLLDDQGRKRASIFYKAAFYDRDAFINIVQRFHAVTRPICGWDSDEYDHDTTPFHGAVLDRDEVIWHTEEAIVSPPHEAERPLHMAYHNQKDALGAQAKTWLNEHYPDWENPLTYWDEEAE